MSFLRWSLALNALIGVGLVGCQDKKSTSIPSKQTTSTTKKTAVQKKLVVKKPQAPQPKVNRVKVQKLYDEAMVLLKDKKPQQARKLFYQATRIDPKFGAAHLQLAKVSQAIGNEKGAHKAAIDALAWIKTTEQRVEALRLIHQYAPKQGAHWEKRAFYDEYLALNALISAKHVQKETLPKIDATVLKQVKRTMAQRQNHLLSERCVAPKVVGPINSPRALCAQFEAQNKQAKCKWGKSPEVTSALQALPLSVEREDGSTAYMALGRKSQWYAVELVERRHATSGLVHESIKQRLFAPKKTEQGTVIRAISIKRRGDEDLVLGMFFKSEAQYGVWCSWDKALQCKKLLTDMHRTIYATKLLSKPDKTPQHVVLFDHHVHMAKDWKDGPSSWAESCRF